MLVFEGQKCTTDVYDTLYTYRLYISIYTLLYVFFSFVHPWGKRRQKREGMEGYGNEMV